MAKSHKGNSKTTYSILGASNHSELTREENDFYATPPIATKELLNMMKKHDIFQNDKEHIKIYEPCVGKGHIAQVLAEEGYNVTGSDLVVRPQPENIKYTYINTSCDFLKIKSRKTDLLSSVFDDCIDNKIIIPDDINIITNPPYELAQECVEHSLEMVQNDNYVIMLLKIQFLEGISRYNLFKDNPPKYVWVFSSRIQCKAGGNFEGIKDEVGGASCYAWYVWQKGYKGSPMIDWILPEYKKD